MSSINCTNYYFTSWLRRGLSSAIRGQAKGPRAKIQVQLTLRAQVLEADDDTLVPLTERELALYGPGDIVGFQPGSAIRMDPRPDVGDFEPNYFPMVEFSEPDFLWRFTPSAPDQESNLLPWLTLVVLVSQGNGEDVQNEFSEGKSAPGLPKCISVQQSSSLPDLAQAWRWAHVQVVAGETAPDLANTLETSPESVTCRLLCARRLLPGTRYTAFVVPTFELGRRAGLGLESDATIDANKLAWDDETDFSSGLRLPYYHRWEFGTGLRGDFERLVRLLEPRKADEIEGLGIRLMDCSAPGYGLSAAEDLKLGLEGALQPIADIYSKWGRDTTDQVDPYRENLQALLNQNKEDVTLSPSQIEAPPETALFTNIALDPDTEMMTSVQVAWTTVSPLSSIVEFYRPGFEKESIIAPNFIAEHGLTIRGLQPGATYLFRIGGQNAQEEKFWTTEGSIQVPSLPKVSPPLYGRWHAAEKSVDDAKPGWFHELNLDPRHRVASGFGAEVIRQQQEPLMAEAWEQLADTEKANNLLRRAQLAREANLGLWKRLDMLDEGSFLQVTSKVLPRIRSSFASTGAGSLIKKVKEESQLPIASMMPAFRRITRRRGSLRRRQSKPWRGNFIGDLAQGTLRAAGPRPTPTGMVEMEAITQALAAKFDPNPGTGGDTTSPTFTAPGGTTGSTVTGLGTSKRESLLKSKLKGTIIQEAIQSGAISEFNLPRVQDMVVTLMGATDDWLNKDKGSSQKPSPPANFLSSLKSSIMSALNPRESIWKQVWSRIQIAPDFMSNAGGDPLDEIMWSPAFDHPMYEPLRDISQDLILPGIQKVPQNSVLTLKTNRRFLEAYMVGLNHEFASELLWRGYPTDQRGSYFRQHWDVRDRVPSPEEPSGEEQRRKAYRDIAPVHLWKESTDLGGNYANSGAQEQLVVLIRGDLFKKYPDTIIYAVEKVPQIVDSTAANQPMVPALREYLRGDDNIIDQVLNNNAPRYPLFRGDLPSDLSFFGFNFSAEDARDKYLVLEQSIAGSAVRFGLDTVIGEEPDQINDWIDLTWGHFKDENDSEGGWYIDAREPVLEANDQTSTPWWRNGNVPSSAQIANITMQLPVRIAIEFDMLLPTTAAD